MELKQRQTNFLSCCGSRRSPSEFKVPKRLHRIAEVLDQEGVSQRTVGDRIGKTEATVRKETQPDNDMLLSELYLWQQALQVPIGELLVESETAFSPPVRLRSKLLKIMRTLRSVQENSTETPVQRLAQQMCEQLLELMPELKQVSAWPTVGQIRKSHEYGAVACNTISDQYLNAPIDNRGEGI